MRCFKTLVVCLVLGGYNSAYSEEKSKSWFELITLNGFASVGYTWNTNDPLSRLTKYRSFDYDHNTVGLHGAELVLQKAVADKGDFGFRLDVTYGNIARGSTARGLFRDPTTGASSDIDVQQALLSYIIPLGRGLRVDVGKFVTPVGVEVIDGFDGFNDNFSRSWLFTYGPFTHTGLKLSYNFHDWVTGSVYLLNGWDNVIDNNAAKSFAVSLALTPSPKLAVYFNYVGGPERDNQNQDFRHLADLVAIYKPHWRFTLIANIDFGYESNGIEEPDPISMGMTRRRDASWLFAVLYARTQIVKRFGLTLRGELFYDFDGNRTGTAQRLMSLTLTPELKVLDNLFFRAEGRIDQSDQFVFEKQDGGGRKYQATFGLNAIALF